MRINNFYTRNRNYRNSPYGITEAENSSKEFYGFDRLCNKAQKNCQLSAADIRQLIIEDVKAFIGEQKVYDDITLVAIKKR